MSQTLSKSLKAGLLTAVGAGLIIVSFFSSPSYAQVATPNIIINEIFYDPVGADTGFEWIELKNTTNQLIDMSYWRFLKAGNSFEEAFEFPHGTVIASQSILTIGEDNSDADIIVAGIGMQNGGSATDGVKLEYAS